MCLCVCLYVPRYHEWELIAIDALFHLLLVTSIVATWHPCSHLCTSSTNSGHHFIIGIIYNTGSGSTSLLMMPFCALYTRAFSKSRQLRSRAHWCWRGSLRLMCGWWLPGLMCCSCLRCPRMLHCRLLSNRLANLCQCQYTSCSQIENFFWAAFFEHHRFRWAEDCAPLPQNGLYQQGGPCTHSI